MYVVGDKAFRRGFGCMDIVLDLDVKLLGGSVQLRQD